MVNSERLKEILFKFCVANCRTEVACLNISLIIEKKYFNFSKSIWNIFLKFVYKTEIGSNVV